MTRIRLSQISASGASTGDVATFDGTKWGPGTGGGGSGSGIPVISASLVGDCPLTGSTTGATDNTAALQSAINDAITAASTGSGTARLYIPKPSTADKCYLISGTPVTGQGGSSQLQFPYRANTTTTPCVIEIIGDEEPNGFSAPGSSEYDLQPTRAGTVLRSTATSGTVFGVAPTSGKLSNIDVVLENLTIRVPDDPACGGFDGRSLNAVRCRGTVRVDTPVSGGSVTQPTHTTTGFAFPDYNNIGPHGADRLAVAGFAVGVRFTEHCRINQLQVLECLAAVQVGQGYHASSVGHAVLMWCPKMIQVDTALTTGPVCPLVIELVDFEETDVADWRATTYHVDDTHSLLYGRARYHRVKANTGQVGTVWAKNGGASFIGSGLMGQTDTTSSSQTDTFNRADNSSSLGTPSDGGAAWSALAATWGISSNKAYVSSFSGQCTAVRDRGAADTTVSADITTSSTTNRIQAGLAFRVVSSNTMLFVVLEADSGGNKISLQKISSGSFTTLGTSTAITIATGTTYALEVELSGSSVTVKVDGTTRITYTLTSGEMTTYGSATKHGLFAWGGPTNDDGGSRWDNYSAT